MLIEQAIFTSARTDRAAGYQLVARSDGILERDAQDLAIWGPSHDSLWDTGADATSTNFHRLPSGAYCVSRTSIAGVEYSGRGGRQVYTQCLIVPPEVLARFAFQPFGLLRAALGQGSLQVHPDPPQRLEPLKIMGRRSTVDLALVTEVYPELGHRWLATLLEALAQCPAVGLVAGPRGCRVVAALVECLPLDARAEFSFSTGLKFSPRRPYRLICLPADPAECRRLERRHDVTVLDLSADPPPAFAPRAPWALQVEQTLRSGGPAALAALLARPLARTGEPSNQPPTRPQHLALRPDAAHGSAAVHEPDAAFPSTADGADNSATSESAADGLDPSLAFPRLANTPFALTPQLKQQLTDALRHNPLDELAWARSTRLHTRCVEQGEMDAASELVYQLCRVLSERGAGDELPQQRVAALLEHELHERPALFDQTVARLRGLPVSSARATWLQVARRVRERETRGGSASNKPAPGTDRLDSADHPATSAADCGLPSGTSPSDAAPRAEYGTPWGDPHADDADPASAPQWSGAGDSFRRADARHDRFESLPQPAPSAATNSTAHGAASGVTSAVADDWEVPALVLGEACPAAIELLEEVDDLVFEAVAGKPQALERLRVAWPEALRQLGPTLMEESRVQYLRHALATWKHCRDGDEVSGASRALAVMEIVCLLMDV